jgi:large subunit ribosomal protein L6
MSRVGKNPVVLSTNIDVKYNDSDRVLIVKGPLGELKFNVSKLVDLEITKEQILCTIKDPGDKYERALWGTTRAIIQNMVTGVSTGFNKELELNGVGYKMELGTQLVLYIGYSHSVILDIPEGIKLVLEKNVLKGEGIDKANVGNFFAKIHNMKPCDPYKQKGFKYPGRFYKKKQGKQGK